MATASQDSPGAVGLRLGTGGLAAGFDRLRAVYEAEVRRAAALGRTLTGDLQTGEDLAQEAFLIAARKLLADPEYLRDPVWPWLRRVVTRLALQRRRRLAREALRLTRLYDCEPPRPDSDARIDYEHALDSLPARMRACVALFYGEDL